MAKKRYCPNGKHKRAGTAIAKKDDFKMKSITSDKEGYFIRTNTSRHNNHNICVSNNGASKYIDEK